MVRMELSKILITETSDYQVIWLREKGGLRTFPILIGIVEAGQSIGRFGTSRHSALSPTTCSAAIITSVGATLERIVVSSLKSNTFYAKLVVQFNGSTVEIDSRPSDAVAVAVRLDAPIYVEDDVLDHVCSGAANPEADGPSPDARHSFDPARELLASRAVIV